jgi:hypothetical protein
MPLLIEFTFRLAFGLAVAMGLTPPARVTGGFYRNHLYVLLGLNVLGTLAARSAPDRFAFWPPVVGAVLSYAGAVAWLYEKAAFGRMTLWLVAAVDLVGSFLNHPSAVSESLSSQLLRLADSVSAGLLLGSTLAAMFLGHWYLNTPTMELAPLKRLIKLMAASLVLRLTVAGTGVVMLAATDQLAMTNLPLLSLRWLSGLLAMAPIVWMTWQTLKIPNTQSGTGILYVGVILTFLGELVSLLLSGSGNFAV